MNTAHNYDVPVEIVLFDLGRVLLDWEPDRLYQKLIPDEKARERFLSTVCTMEWHNAHDAGASFADNARALIRKFPEHGPLIRAWGDRWFEMFNGYIEGVPALIDQLKTAKVPLFALSNMPSDPWEEMQTHFPYLKSFIDVIVSGDEKCVKPGPEIYKIALARMGNPPPETVLFIDDGPANIDAANAQGFQTHLFTSARSLETALIKRKLIG